ncbi:MAG: GDP-mannose 4,6-dehydratase [bacterium]|nr:GDP-mannose 4,6-dehydratase [bacterium]
MASILVTGATGFVGSHFCDYLLGQNIGEVHATKRYRSPLFDLKDAISNSKFKLHECELRDFSSVYKLIDEIKPDYIFHFAAQGSVGVSWNYPITTIKDDVEMQVNIFESVKLLGLTPKIWIPGSAEEHGVIKPEDLPIKESLPLKPISPYAVGKATQELLVYQYNASYKLPIYITRSFNQEGPRRPDAFVISSFAKQIACIEKYDLEPIIKVGNLEAKRDFIDVRDSVKAYWLIVDKGNPVDPYNVSSGTTHAIQEVLDSLLSFSTKKIKVEQDPSRMRPSDIPELLGDNSKLKALGWKLEIPFEITLQDTLKYWRENA